MSDTTMQEEVTGETGAPVLGETDGEDMDPEADGAETGTETGEDTGEFEAAV